MMTGSRSVAWLALGAGFVTSLALRSAELGTLPWAISRASGLAAFAVLSASVVLGLLISTKAGDGILSRHFVFDMHQFLAVASLALIALHAGSLLFDSFFNFTSLSLIIPFAAPYKPLAVGMGVLAGWLTAVTAASFWFRSRIGVKRWRTLHYLTFLAYFGALGHGVFAGTDTELPFVYWGYVASAGAVLALTVLRISGYRQADRTTSSLRDRPAKALRPLG